MSYYVRLSVLVALIAPLTAPSALAAKGEKFPAPIHPDTLPTLIRSWSLPASLASNVANAHTPRIGRSGDRLFIFDHNGRRIVAVNINTGEVLWHKPVATRSDVAFSVTPLIVRRRVFVASDGFLYCFDAKTGKQRWRVGTRGTAINGLARSKRHIYLPLIRVDKGHGVKGVQLWSVDSRQGRVEWTRKLPGATGYVRGNALGAYFVNDAGLVMGLTPDRGEPKWKLRVKGQINTPPILKGGKLYLTAARRKVGWAGTSLYVVDAVKGKLIWKAKLNATKVGRLLYEGKLVTVDSSGAINVFDDAGKVVSSIQLPLDDQPQGLVAAAAGSRVYAFSYHEDGHGYVHLVDMKQKRALAKANALDMPVRGLISVGKSIVLDGEDGTIHTYRLDRSERPKRRSVPAAEFARQLIDDAKDANAPMPGLARKLTGIGLSPTGDTALKPLAKGLASSNAYVVDAVARAIGRIGNRKSVPALLETLAVQLKTPPGKAVDPAQSILDALARIRDGRAIKLLRGLMADETQSHRRRRTAYVALGAIGSAAALGPIWHFRASKALNTMRWQPQPHTQSYAYTVEQDVPPTTDASIRKKHAKTITTKDGRSYTLALSPYLGGYNDLWIGESDAEGTFFGPLFTGLTKAEIRPNQRIALTRLSIKVRPRMLPKAKRKPSTTKDAAANAQQDAPDPETPEERLSRINAIIGIKMRIGKRWLPARAVQVNLGTLSQDTDHDGLPDIVERRLQLCVTHPDCDGDGIKDSEDVNPIASGKLKLTAEQKVFREAFFTFFAFLKRRGVVVIDPGDGPSFEVYGRQDPVLSLRRSSLTKLRKQVGLHAIDFVSFGGPYPEGGGSGDAMKAVVWGKNKRSATIGMDIVRSGDNAAAFNVRLKRLGRNWVVTDFRRVWTTH